MSTLYCEVMTSTVPLALITILSIFCRMQAKKANLFFVGQSERKTVFPPFNFAFPITCLILLFLWLWHYEKAKFKHSRWYVSAHWFQSLYEKKGKIHFLWKNVPVIATPSSVAPAIVPAHPLAAASSAATHASSHASPHHHGLRLDGDLLDLDLLALDG